MRSSRKLIGAIAAVALATGALVTTSGPVGAGEAPALEFFEYGCVGADEDSQAIVEFIVPEGVITVETGIAADVPVSLNPGESSQVGFFWQLALSQEAIQTARDAGILSIDLTDISLAIDIAGSAGAQTQVVGTPPDASVNIENDPVDFPVLGPFTGDVTAGDDFDIVYLLGNVELTVFLPSLEVGFSLVCAPTVDCFLTDTFVTGVTPPDIECPVPPRPPVTPTTNGDGTTGTTAAGAGAAATPRFTG
jgi:hypothetical protein